MSRFIVQDHYFQKAKKAGYVARSIFKLEEIDQRLKLIKPHHLVLDLGSAPGSWLQYLAQKLKTGKALGVDLNPIKENFPSNIIHVQDDVFLLNKEKIVNYLNIIELDFKGLDVILSDMAPKTSGIKNADQLKSLALAEKAFALALDILKPGGHLVIKIFQSGEVYNFIKEIKKHFLEVKQMRPKTVRTVSKEFYIVGLSKK